VAHQINIAFNQIDDFEKRQKETVEKVTTTLDRQSQALRNQTQLLENQQKILNELHRWQQNYRNPMP
jgi:hypothetical protein